VRNYCLSAISFNNTKLVYFELQEVTPGNANGRQIRTYTPIAFYGNGNNMATKLCLTFVFRWLWLSRQAGQTRDITCTVSNGWHSLAVVAFGLDFYFIQHQNKYFSDQF
jgi:hypothetical protein